MQARTGSCDVECIVRASRSAANAGRSRSAPMAQAPMTRAKTTSSTAVSARSAVLVSTTEMTMIGNSSPHMPAATA